MLTVKAGTESGTPARWETCRAVFGPPPACRACPKIVSSTAAAGSPDRSSAAVAAAVPRSAADSEAKEPPNFPIGVRDGGEDVDGAHASFRVVYTPNLRPQAFAPATAAERDDG